MDIACSVSHLESIVGASGAGRLETLATGLHAGVATTLVLRPTGDERAKSVELDFRGLGVFGVLR